MRTVIAMCTLVISLGLAGLAVRPMGTALPMRLNPGCQPLPRMAAVHV